MMLAYLATDAKSIYDSLLKPASLPKERRAVFDVLSQGRLSLVESEKAKNVTEGRKGWIVNRGHVTCGRIRLC